MAMALLVGGVLVMSAADFPKNERRILYNSDSGNAFSEFWHNRTVTPEEMKAMMEDPRAAGLYAAAFSLSRLPMFLLHGVGAAVFPRVSEALERGHRDLARSVSTEAMRFVIVLFVPICFITACSASDILTFVYSARYVEAERALVLLCPAILFAALMQLSWRLVAAANRPHINLLMIYIVLGIAVGLNLVLIPKMGISGAAGGQILGPLSGQAHRVGSLCLHQQIENVLKDIVLG